MKEIWGSTYLADTIERYEQRKWIALAVSLISFCASPFFVPLFVIAVVALIFAVVQANNAVPYKAGFMGEERLRGRLRNILPQRSTMFHNIKTPYGDIDCIAMTPAGLYAFEAKHHEGEIYHNGKKWSHIKTGCRGTRYEGEKLRNPSGQLIGTIMWLKNQFKEKGLNPWVNGMVVFTHPSTTVHTGNIGNIGVMMLNDMHAGNFYGKARLEVGLALAIEKCLSELANPGSNIKLTS